MKVLATLAACAALAGLGVSQASAADFTFDLSGISTDAGFGASFPTLTHDFGFAGLVTGVDFNVNYESFDPSYQSEVQVAIDTNDDNSLDADIDFGTFGAPDAPGTFTGSGSVTGNTLSSNGLVYLTAYESFPDIDAVPDATFGQGSIVTVHFAPVPAPSGLAVLGVPGLIGMGVMLRRRRK